MRRVIAGFLDYSRSRLRRVEDAASVSRFLQRRHERHSALPAGGLGPDPAVAQAGVIATVTMALKINISTNCDAVGTVDSLANAASYSM
jgi:hypothetical protein